MKRSRDESEREGGLKKGAIAINKITASNMTKKIDESHISDLQYDPRNARKRTIRSSAMIQSSLQEVGASRSIVIDEHNRILAGNGTIEAAGQIGIEKMIIVDADGETIVAVRRSGLTEQQKIKLALFDNRTSDLSEWDADVLAELGQEVDLSGLFTENDLAVILANDKAPDFDPVGMDEQGKLDEIQPKEIDCECPHCGKSFIKIL